MKSWRHMGQQRDTFNHPARQGPWNKCLQGVKRTSLSGPKISMQMGHVCASPSWSGARSSSSSGEGLSVWTTRHTFKVPVGAALLVVKAPERMRTTKIAVERDVAMQAIARAKPTHAKRAVAPKSSGAVSLQVFASQTSTTPAMHRRKLQNCTKASYLATASGMGSSELYMVGS